MDDCSVSESLPSGLIDILPGREGPSIISAVGLGHKSSIKPDLFYEGGRVFTRVLPNGGCCGVVSCWIAITAVKLKAGVSPWQLFRLPLITCNWLLRSFYQLIAWPWPCIKSIKPTAKSQKITQLDPRTVKKASNINPTQVDNRSKPGCSHYSLNTWVVTIYNTRRLPGQDIHWQAQHIVVEVRVYMFPVSLHIQICKSFYPLR